MQIKKGEGFILNKKEIGEKDVLIEIIFKDTILLNYSKYKLKIFGILNSKKRNPVVVEIGNYVSVDFYYKENLEIHNIKEINLIDRFSQIKKNYEDFFYFSKLIQITNLMSVSEKDLEEIYKLFYFASFFIENYLKDRDLEIQNILESFSIQFWEIIFLFYIVRLLKISGYVGDIDHCANCNQLLIDKAKWQEGMYFYCSHCDLTANHFDFISKKIIKKILQNKFKNFLNKLKEEISLQDKEFDFIPLLEYIKKKINYILNDLISKPMDIFFGLS